MEISSELAAASRHKTFSELVTIHGWHGVAITNGDLFSIAGHVADFKTYLDIEFNEILDEDDKKMAALQLGFFDENAIKLGYYRPEGPSHIWRAYLDGYQLTVAFEDDYR